MLVCVRVYVRLCRCVSVTVPCLQCCYLAGSAWLGLFPFPFALFAVPLLNYYTRIFFEFFFSVSSAQQQQQKLAVNREVPEEEKSTNNRNNNSSNKTNN